MRPLILKVFIGLATAAAAQCIVAQSHVQLIERTPCLYEYRVWAFTFRRPQPFPVPRDFTVTQCTAAEQVHERIERERVEADAVPDPSRGSNDTDERAIDCLHEYRLWRATMKTSTDFIEALDSFAPFKVHGRELCREAKLADERISAETAIKAAREKVESELVRQELAKAESTRRQRDAAAKATREAKARLPGVSIGITPEDVIQRTHWGAPRGKNRTITAFGVREQWVYDNNHYLYFENGKLVAIQN